VPNEAEPENSALEEPAMARVEGPDPSKTSLLMRQVFKKARKILGRDLTPQKTTACDGLYRKRLRFKER